LTFGSNAHRLREVEHRRLLLVAAIVAIAASAFGVVTLRSGYQQVTASETSPIDWSTVPPPIGPALELYSNIQVRGRDGRWLRDLNGKPITAMVPQPKSPERNMSRWLNNKELDRIFRGKPTTISTTEELVKRVEFHNADVAQKMAIVEAELRRLGFPMPVEQGPPTLLNQAPCPLAIAPCGASGATVGSPPSVVPPSVVPTLLT
jgi:hypothetical protein